MNAPVNRPMSAIDHTSEHAAERAKSVIGQLRAFRDFILVIVSLFTGGAWVTSYFATQDQLDRYKCINNLTITMLVNNQSAQFFEQVFQSNRKDLRTMERALTSTPKDSPGYQALVDQIDDQKIKIEDVRVAQESAAKTKEDALKQLQDIQSGIAKPCKK